MEEEKKREEEAKEPELEGLPGDIVQEALELHKKVMTVHARLKSFLKQK